MGSFCNIIRRNYRLMTEKSVLYPLFEFHCRQIWDVFISPSPPCFILPSIFYGIQLPLSLHLSTLEMAYYLIFLFYFFPMSLSYLLFPLILFLLFLLFLYSYLLFDLIPQLNCILVLWLLFYFLIPFSLMLISTALFPL